MELQTFAIVTALGIIQAFAELLPVSSSAHVILFQKLFGIDPAQPEQTFVLVMLHTGTMVTVFCLYWKRWKVVYQQWILPLIIATGITGLFGLFLKYCIERTFYWLQLPQYLHMEDLFRSLPLLSITLCLGGSLIWIASQRKPQQAVLTYGTALWIGFIQGFCLPFRGFSRSGATISMGMIRGLSIQTAENFSFALAVFLTPPILIREFWKLRTLHTEITWNMIAPGCYGFCVSSVASLLALRLLSHLINQQKWRFFAFYSFGFSLLVLIASFWL
jgi:undecaprenyl-diphosphatase